MPAPWPLHAAAGPEVALALKLRRTPLSRCRMCRSIFFMDTSRPPCAKKRSASWRNAANRCLVVGTRSALFLPLPSLGAVVLDEEHDSSFKQDEGLTYQAKEVAWFRIAQAKGLLVLGSATPDLKTFYAVREAKIPCPRFRRAWVAVRCLRSGWWTSGP